MGSCFPYNHPRAQEIVDFVKKVHKALGYTDGATHVEVMIGLQGQLEIIDFNPRFIGADVMQSINHAFGVRIQDALLELAQGKRPTSPFTQKQVSCIQYVLCPPVDRFESIEFPKDAEVVFSTSFIKPGSVMKRFDKQLDYVGCYLTVMPTVQEALKRSYELRSKVIINGGLNGVY